MTTNLQIIEMSKTKAFTKDSTTIPSRTKYFTTAEDIMVCGAYVHTSQDPIKGNDQKLGILW
jgi:hypothetical protein